MFLERSARVSSVAIEAAVTVGHSARDQGEVRNVQGSSMHNENLSSARSTCGSLLKWRESEWRVSGKGKKRDIHSFPLSLSLAILSVRYLNDWIFSPPVYQLLFVDRVCSFTVCFLEWMLLTG